MIELGVDQIPGQHPPGKQHWDQHYDGKCLSQLKLLAAQGVGEGPHDDQSKNRPHNGNEDGHAVGG